MKSAVTSRGDAAQPVLSICVPTYNRSAWLHAMLTTVVPQAAALGGLVEVVVSDNASTDNTPDVVRQVQAAHGPIRYNRNETNVGAEPNYHKALSEVASGTFAWLLGDDDFLAPGAVAKVLAAIQENPDLEYLYVNYHVWHCNTPPPPDEPLPQFERSENCNAQMKDGRIPALVEIVGWDPNCFTPMSCSIMRREQFVEAVYRDPSLEPFASAKSVSPISLFIAHNLLHRPAYCFGEPLTILGTASSWEKYHPAFILIVYPELFQAFEENGAPAKIMDGLRRESIRNIVKGYRKLRTDPTTPGHNHFSLRRYIRLNRRVSDVYFLHYYAFVWPVLEPSWNRLTSLKVSRFILHRLWLMRQRKTMQTAEG